jgi:hypothetical protein
VSVTTTRRGWEKNYLMMSTTGRSPALLQGSRSERSTLVRELFRTRTRMGALKETTLVAELSKEVVSIVYAPRRAKGNEKQWSAEARAQIESRTITRREA